MKQCWHNLFFSIDLSHAVFQKKLVGDGTINIILYFANFVNCENARLQIIVSLEF